MKKGSGDDPFASDDEEGEEPSTDVDDTADLEAAAAATTEPATASDNQPASAAAQSADNLPYLARRQLRNKSVKADRDQIPFFLRGTVQQGERDLRRALEDMLSQEVNKTDLREAAYVFAQRHPEGVADVLREWGIEYLE